MSSLSAGSYGELTKTFDAILFSTVVGLAIALAIWQLADGISEHSALLFTRYTARLSFLFFLPVFTLHALQVLVPTIPGRALLKKRRQLGLAFAFAHFVHLLAIVMYYNTLDRWFTLEDTPALIIYLLIGLMAVTSNTFSLTRLKSNWGKLHKVGIYGVFIGFFTTYLGRVQEYGQQELPAHLTESFWVYVVLLVAVSGAWLLRIVAFWKLRRRKV